MPQRFGTVLAGDARLAVREWGPEDGAPVLFWHALGPVTTGEYAAELAPALAARGARVSRPTGPGTASHRPSRARYAVAATVELALALLDGLGLRRVAFVGHSWGAMVGAHLAAAAPERLSALVLLDAGYGDPADQPGVGPLPYHERLAQARTAQAAWRWPSWDVFDVDASDGLRRTSPELAAVFRAGVREQDGAVVARVAPEARAAIQDALYASSISTTWPALDALPVLLLVGDRAAGPGRVPPRRRRPLPRRGADGGRRRRRGGRARRDRRRRRVGRHVPRRLAGRPRRHVGAATLDRWISSCSSGRSPTPASRPTAPARCGAGPRTARRRTTP